MEKKRCVAFRAFAAAMVVAATGCSTKPVDQYTEWLVPNESRAVDSIKEALELAGAIQIENNVPVNFTIDTQSPIIKLDGRLSYFQLFKVHCSAPRPISFTTDSLVDGKYLIWPRVFLTKANGDVITAKETSGKTDFSHLGLGFARYRAMWEGRAERPGDYYILVMSDNRVVGSVVAGNSYTASPTGAMVIELN